VFNQRFFLPDYRNGIEGRESMYDSSTKTTKEKKMMSSKKAKDPKRITNYSYLY